MLIRIIACPPGFAPEEVRRGWVGITFQSEGREAATSAVKKRRKGKENVGGYIVNAADAFETLKTHNRASYDWWAANYPHLLLDDGSTLIFHTNVCQIVH